MELYYEVVRVGNTTFKIARFRIKPNITSKEKNPKSSVPFSKWSKLKKPRDAAKRYFTKNNDSDGLKLLKCLNTIITTVVKEETYQFPKGSGISKVGNQFRVQGRVGKEINMYLGTYSSKEEAQRIIDMARKKYQSGISESEIRKEWQHNMKLTKNTQKEKTNVQYRWECPQCSKVLRSKNGHKGHVEMHAKKNHSGVKIRKKIRIVFKKKTDCSNI
jgi:hypothetical protein